MGTIYNIKIIHSNLDDKLLGDIKEEIEKALKNVNQQMSTYISDSEISRFNTLKDTNEFQVSRDLFTVLKEAIYIHNISDGAFDITVNPLVALWGFGNKTSQLKPPQNNEVTKALKKIGTKYLTLVDSIHIKKEILDLEIDLSAIAKGYGVDVIARRLENFQIQNYLVEIGGEIYTKGINLREKKWGIGIDRPRYQIMSGRELQDTIYVSNVAVATSGDYRNFFEFEGKIYSHTINPKTGRPVTHNLASVTIIAPSCMRADALATAVMVMGTEKGLKLLESLENVEGLLLERLNDGKFEEFQTEGLKKYSQ
jgi:thiamine biosynthesis lipoprotein